MDAPEIVHMRRRRYQRFFRRTFMLGAALVLVLFAVPLIFPMPLAPYVPTDAVPSRLIPDMGDWQLILVSILLAVVLWSLAGWITATVLLWMESFRKSPSPRFHTR